MDLENCDRLVQCFLKERISCNRHLQLENLVETALSYTEIFKSILQHLKDVEQESTAVLLLLLDIVKVEQRSLAPYFSDMRVFFLRNLF
ncbi:unnamed protein product [Gongylonema pulchrum]|uniref:Nuclear receptor n=1 Tax=Gongylonema pulchrum TaxID=637853 RepID=A0A183D8V7_9BILA|nr:unnamed protein product [Gongylonema pulchrum]